MQEKSNESNIVRVVGLIGIIGVLITIISDFILIGRPVSAYSFFKLGTESMVGLAQWRITIGTFLGILVLPFQISGLIAVYYGLKPAGKIKSLVVAITAAHALIIGVAFHVSYAFMGSGWKLYYDIGVDNIIGTELVKRFDYYWRIIAVVLLVELVFSSIGYVLIILTRKTLYPKWMAILNPLCVFIFLFPLISILPAPIGGFIAPAYFNIATLVFFIFSTTACYRKLKSLN